MTEPVPQPKLIELLAECNYMLGFDRAINIAHLVLQTQRTPGEIAELGTARGATARLITALTTKTVYVYDSFEGLPEIPPEEQVDPSWKRGTFTFSADDLLAEFQRHGLRPPVVWKGWFADIPPDRLPDQLAFVHIDGDLYQSTMDALTKIYDRLVPGAVVVIDDYGWDVTPGVHRACIDFLQDKPERMTPLLVRPSEVPHACFVKE